MLDKFKKSEEFCKAVYIIEKLNKFGFKSFICGGCVRDMLLSHEPKDIDIVTSALPDQIEAIFEKTIPVGKQFGIIIVLIDEEEFEVASMRNDGNYIDGRRPDSITFSTPEEDASRRDFTINGLFFNPLNNEIIDFVGGKADIEAKKIRFIGNAQERIEEDRLRILRAIRFTAKLGFSIDNDTLSIIKTNAHRINDISAERIKNELDKMMMTEKPSIAFEMLHSVGLLKYILPEVDCLWDCEQSKKWHMEGSTGIHTMLVLDNTRKMTDDLNTLWSALLHDIGKPATSKINEDGNISCHGHDKLGAEMTLNILIRMKASNVEKDEVTVLVKDHMNVGSAIDMKKSTLRRLCAQPHFNKLMVLFEADCLSSFPEDPDRNNDKLDGVKFLKEFAIKMGDRIVLPTPFITGKHLIDLGLKPGPKFKDILTSIMDMQLEGEVKSLDDGLRIVKSIIGE